MRAATTNPQSHISNATTTKSARRSNNHRFTWHHSKRTKPRVSFLKKNFEYFNVFYFRIERSESE